MKLPFIILNRVTYDKLISDLEYKQTMIDDMTSDLIQKREENKNLRYNYERIKDEYKDLTHRFNKLLHTHNKLKKQTNATTRS